MRSFAFLNAGHFGIPKLFDWLGTSKSDVYKSSTQKNKNIEGRDFVP